MSGTLDTGECRALVKEYIQASAARMPKMMGAGMSSDISRLSGKITRIMEKMYSEEDSVAQISDGFRAKLDRNHDGSITALEFHENFVTAMGDVTQRVQQALLEGGGA